MRFASETLGLLAPAVSAGPSAPAPAGQQQLSAETTNPSSTVRAVDIRQFTESKAPKTDQQFAAVVAYYYRFVAPAEKQKEVIGAKDLIEAARLADRKRPKDAGMTLTNAKNKGYLDAAGRAKFQINTVGENLVAMTLPGKDRPKPSKRKRGNTSNKKKGKAPAKKRGKAGK